jgi:hypothetical protein
MREDSIHNKCSTLMNEKSKHLRTQKHGILLKVALNTITLIHSLKVVQCRNSTKIQ